MTIISLEGIHLHGHIGYYDEEQVIGNEFLIDIHLMVDTKKAAKEDDLFKTINYEMVYHICLAEMRKKDDDKKYPKLIESVAKRLLDRLNDQFEQLEGAKVKIKKLNPPLGGSVAAACIEMSSGMFDLPTSKDLKKIKDLKL